MKVALVGASGNVGQRILAELLLRHHTVTAIGRRLETIPTGAGVTPKQADAGDAAALAPVLKGHDAIVSSVKFLDSDAEALIAAVKTSGVKRYLVVGGAGSLEVAPGVRLVTVPNFPEIYKAEALKGAAFLDRLAQETDLDWTYFSPSAFFHPGERTGKYRLGKNDLISDADGKSSISYEDYAIALVDELEKPAHVKSRFTIGY